MNKNKINWENFEEKIINIKYPTCFIYLLFKNNNKLNDNNFSLVLRYFLKHNQNLAINHKFIDLLHFLNIDKINSRRVINDFYLLIRKKIIISILLKKWKISYSKDNFWNKNIDEQIEHLTNIKSIFLANFEVNKNNILFHYKIKMIYQKNEGIRNQLINIMIERLRNIFLIFGMKFFKNYNIITIKISKFKEFNMNQKIKYCDYIFNKINKILFKITNYFIIFKYIQNQLFNILNPKPIRFDGIKEDSDTKIDDILFIIEN